MARQARKAKPAAPGRAARGGAGAALPPGETGIEEALRHCRGIALDIGADGFGALLSVPSSSRSLSTVFDCDFPLPSPYLAAFLDVHDGEVARHALATSAPLWWGAAAQATDFAALPWGLRLASHCGVAPGIAFPCYPERGPNGLVLFWGPRLAVGPDTMPDIHGRCFALLEAVSLLRGGGEAKRPQMSKREIECLELTAQGRTSNQIAKLLGLSVHTTNQHLEEAGRKLNSVNRIHAVAKALRLGLIE